MRTYTIFVSVIAHCAAVVAIMTASIMGSDELPAVRRAVDFVEIRAVAPPQATRRSVGTR